MTAPPQPPPPPPLPTVIDLLNSRADLDFKKSYNSHYVDENLNDDPYLGINIRSSFFDIQSLKAANYGPLFLSINI